jgi:hypothetical protein
VAGAGFCSAGGILGRFRFGGDAGGAPIDDARPPAVAVAPRAVAPRGIDSAPVMLAGQDELRVVGVTYRPHAVAEACRATGAAGVSPAVLVPDPENEHDSFAVKVVIGIAGHHVGWLSRHISPVLQPALIAFSVAHDSRPVGCGRASASGRSAWGSRSD